MISVWTVIPAVIFAFIVGMGTMVGSWHIRDRRMDKAQKAFQRRRILNAYTCGMSPMDRAQWLTELEKHGDYLRAAHEMKRTPKPGNLIEEIAKHVEDPNDEL